MADIFISYRNTPERRALVRRLASVLRAHGFSVWWDYGLEAGDSFRTQILKELTDARVVVPLWCEESIRSKWVLMESELSKDKLVPARIQNVAPPEDFSALQAANLTEWHGTVFDAQLLAFVRTLSVKTGRELVPIPDLLEELAMLPNLDPLPQIAALPGNATPDAAVSGTRTDWGDAPIDATMYGRDGLIADAQRWIVDEKARVVGLLGIGGIGKTSLAARIADNAKGAFDFAIWRSLQSAPSPQLIFERCIQFFSSETALVPADPEEQVLLLLRLMREKRCLIVLDNFETVLGSPAAEWQYRREHAMFERFLVAAQRADHQSCVIFTSREWPPALVRSSDHPATRMVDLSGLDREGAQLMLGGRQIFGSDADWDALVRVYDGNPLALKLVSDAIQLAGGRIADFLEDGNYIVNDLQHLLEEQLARLAKVEREVIMWLAIVREPHSMIELEAHFNSPVGRGPLIEGLMSLRRRHLIEQTSDMRFLLQPVILEHVTRDIVRTAAQELIEGTPVLLASHGLKQAKTKEFVSAAQEHVFVAPTLAQVKARLGAKPLGEHLRNVLQQWAAQSRDAQDYRIGNVLTLLIASGADIRGLDLSGTTIRDVDFSVVSMAGMNLSHAHLVNSVFASTFGSIFGVAFSPVERLMAVCSDNGEICTWSVPDGQMRMSFRGHGDWVRSVAFSPDGKLLVSGGHDLGLRLWDVATGACLKVIKGHTNRIRSVAVSRSGAFLASGAEDGTVRIWDAASGECLHVLEHHQSRLWSVAFSPTEDILASAGEDAVVRLWDAASGEARGVLGAHEDWIRSIAFTADGRHIVSGSHDCTARLWNLATMSEVRRFEGHANRIRGVAVSNDGRIVATGSEDHTVKLWSLETGECERTLHGHRTQLRSVAFSVDDVFFASGSEDHMVRIWEVATGQCLRTLRGNSSLVRSVSFSPDGRRLATGGEDQVLRVWDAADGHELHALEGHTNRIWCVAYSPDGAWIATGSADETVCLWDAQTGARKRVLAEHTSWVWTLAFSADSALLATGGHDHLIKVWDVATGRCLETLAGHDSQIEGVTFLPDDMLASCSEDGTIRIWTLGGRTPPRILRGHDGQVRSVRANRDGTRLASASQDRTVRIWNVATGELEMTFSDHDSWTWNAAFSPDGKHVASSSEDGTIRIWNLEKRECERSIELDGAWLWSVDWRPDGKALAVTVNTAEYPSGGKIQLLDASTGEHLLDIETDRLYETVDITGIQGLTSAERELMLSLGAVARSV